MVLDIDDFEAPVGHWARIRDALSPSQHDPRPAAWQGLALLEIQTDDKNTLRVDVFWLPNEPVGAFAVESTALARKYYRGGNSRELEEAIVAAYGERVDRE